MSNPPVIPVREHGPGVPAYRPRPIPLGTWVFPIVLVLGLVCVAPARAQVDPEGGDTGAWQAPSMGDPEAGDGSPTGDTGDDGADAGGDGDDRGDDGERNVVPDVSGDPHARGDHHPISGDALPEVQDPPHFTDHHDVVHRYGVGFFGILDVVSGPIDPTTGSVTRIDAPSLGVRHWLSDLLGIEGAIGIGFTNTSVDIDGEGDNLGSSFGLVLHGGLPITLYHYKHYAFLVIPEVNLGLGGGSAPSPIADGDDDFFGVLFDLGVRLGAEIHFGFIGIPDLSLQAAVGVRLRVEFARETVCIDAGCDETADNSVTITNIATTIQGDPWDIFAGAITAIYYF